MIKTRTDAWGEDLPEATRWRIYEELRTAGFDEVRRKLALEGVPHPSRAGWYRFLARQREEAAAKTIIGVETSKRIAQGIVRAEVDARLAADMMTALSVDAAAQGNEEAAKILADSAAKYHAAALGDEKLKLDRARQKTSEEQLKLAREKFEAAEKRLSAVQGAVDEPKLTDAERVAKIKSIFGMR